jgi:hypothetical protein
MPKSAHVSAGALAHQVNRATPIRDRPGGAVRRVLGLWQLLRGRFFPYFEDLSKERAQKRFERVAGIVCALGASARRSRSWWCPRNANLCPTSIGWHNPKKQASSTPVPRIGTLILPHCKVVRDIDREIELRECPGKVKALFAFTQGASIRSDGGMGCGTGAAKQKSTIWSRTGFGSCSFSTIRRG